MKRDWVKFVDEVNWIDLIKYKFIYLYKSWQEMKICLIKKYVYFQGKYWIDIYNYYRQ